MRFSAPRSLPEGQFIDADDSGGEGVRLRLR
jgi:hypothetical protein